MKNKMTMTLCSCAALAAFTPSLRAATTLLDNTSDLIFNYDTGVAALDWGSGVGQAVAFSTGSTAYNLGSIQFVTNQDRSGNFTVTLYSGAKPTGSALASETFSFAAPANGVLAANLTGFSLAANSTYSLALVADSGSGDLFGADPFPTLSPGSSGLTYLGRAYSPGNGNDSWSGPFGFPTPWMKLTDTAGTTSGIITSGGETSAVPEASTSLGLLALGAGGLLTRRRSKRAA